MSIKYLDADTKTTTEVIHFPSTLTLANLQEWADTAVPHLDDSVGTKIVEVRVGMVLSPSTWDLKASPVAGYSTSRGGLLSFICADGSPYSVFVPGVLNTFTSGGELSVTGTLDNFRDDLLDGVFDDPTQVIASARNGSELDTFRRGKITDRDKL